MPSFESLPGTSFTVFGAPIPHDSALTSASAQLFFAPKVLLKFDGEFASASKTYAGTSIRDASISSFLFRKASAG